MIEMYFAFQLLIGVWLIAWVLKERVQKGPESARIEALINLKRLMDSIDQIVIWSEKSNVHRASSEPSGIHLGSPCREQRELLPSLGQFPG